MKISRTQFEFVIEELNAGRSIKEAAIAHVLSERQVQRIKEAGTWERWPYIVAKATHGYNTPEYKLYLKRRGLPATIPSKLSTTATDYVDPADVAKEVLEHEPLMFRLIKRLFGR